MGAETSVIKTWWPSLYNRINFIKRNENHGVPRKILVSGSHYLGNLFHARDFLPALRDHFHADTVTFSFQETPDRAKLRWLERLSCPCLLNKQDLKHFQEEACSMSGALIKKLHGPEDLVAYCAEGTPLGILIHDHYLRRKCVAQVNIKSPDFYKTLTLGINIYLAVKKFYQTNNTVLVWADHPVYLESGVVLQTAGKFGVPGIHIAGGSSPMVFKIPPPKTRFFQFESKMGYQVPYEEFPQLFTAMKPGQKKKAILWGRQNIKKHLSGKRRDIVAGGFSPFQTTAIEKIKNPKEITALILPRDFSDAPNVYGKMLFPDNLSWLYFLLEESQKTNFGWALKPHPNRWGRDGEKMNWLNNSILEKVRQQFPHIEFLQPRTTYPELIRRGLKTVFTPCGTVGHELPPMGVAVVNGGRNPHISYDFNYHPSSIQELKKFVQKAHRLTPKCTQAIEKYHYMRYKYLQENYAIKCLWPKSFDQALEVAQSLPVEKGLRVLDHQFPPTTTVRREISGFMRKKISQTDLANP